jgi:hypothetical protein
MGVALLAAAGLHLLGWAFLSDTGLSRPDTARDAAAPKGLQVRVVSRPASALVLAKSQVSPAPLPAAVPFSLGQAHRPPSAAVPHTLPSLYWPAEALERSPQPQRDWIVDEAVLEREHRARVVLRLWVSELGRIDRFEVLQSEPQGQWPNEALRSLADTPMEPGVRHGQPVQSTVVVEIATVAERFE